jgi:hypothetical protein
MTPFLCTDPPRRKVPSDPFLAPGPAVLLHPQRLCAPHHVWCVGARFPLTFPLLPIPSRRLLGPRLDGYLFHWKEGVGGIARFQSYGCVLRHASEQSNDRFIPSPNNHNIQSCVFPLRLTSRSLFRWGMCFCCHKSGTRARTPIRSTSSSTGSLNGNVEVTTTNITFFFSD